jgi:formate/nitrite transporter FocA (FNT family)
MTSDLNPTSADAEESLKKSAEQILKSEISEGVSAIERTGLALFISGLSAGLDVGFSVLLMAVMWTLAEGHLSSPVVAILMANMYSVGFIFVVIGRSELFTEQTTLAVLPVLAGRASVLSLLRTWAIILLANLIGAAIFAAIAAFVAPSLKVASVAAFGHIAARMTQHSSGIIFSSAVLAGWLMGLLSWLVAAARDTISQIAIVWIITTTIGFAGLHHVVLGSVEVLAGLFLHQGAQLFDYGNFLLWAALGNIVGGVIFVALIKYGHARPFSEGEPNLFKHPAYAGKDR